MTVDEQGIATPSSSTVTAATLRVLEEADRVDTPAGRNALVLAGVLDARDDTGAALAAVSKQHLAALDVALLDVATAGDPLADELEALRARRAGRG